MKLKVLILICLWGVAVGDPEENIKNVWDFYNDIFTVVLFRARGSLHAFLEIYHLIVTSDMNWQTTERYAASIHKQVDGLRPHKSKAPFCVLYNDYRSARKIVATFNDMSRGLQMKNESDKQRLVNSMKRMLDLYAFWYDNCGSYRPSQTMTLLDYAIFRENKDKGKYLSRYKAGYTPCCWGVDRKIGDWERHNFRANPEWKKHHLNYDSDKPIGVNHFDAFMTNGNYYVTWDTHWFGSWEYYQLRHGCDVRTGCGTTEKSDSEEDNVDAINDNNVYFCDILVIQSQRDNTYFHLNHDYTMTSKNRTDSFWVLLREDGVIPDLPNALKEGISCTSGQKADKVKRSSDPIDFGPVPVELNCDANNDTNPNAESNRVS